MPGHLEEQLHAPLYLVLQEMQDRILTQTTYFGVPTLRCPVDFWIYQELIVEMRPDVIVEIGNYCGGSALAVAHLCDLLGHGRVIGVDLSHVYVADRVRQHPRISFIDGDACASFRRGAAQIGPDESVLVIEDSSHTYENTLNVLRTYSALIRPGGYFIVEDSIYNHGLAGGPMPGPFEAIETFLEETPAFESDRQRESFVIT